jgi:hypothetical protein
LDAQYDTLKNVYDAADNPVNQQEALSQLLLTMAGG